MARLWSIQTPAFVAIAVSLLKVNRLPSQLPMQRPDSYSRGLSCEKTRTLYGPMLIVPEAGKPSRGASLGFLGSLCDSAAATTSEQAWFPKARL